MQGVKWPLAAAVLAVLIYAGWHLSGTGEAEQEPPAAGADSAPAGPASVKARPPAEPEDGGAGAEPLPRKDPDLPAADDAPAAPDAETAAILLEMRETRDCFLAPDCTVGANEDPRAEYFEAGDRIAAGVRSLIERHRAGAMDSAVLADIVDEFMEVESGRTRAAAIEAMGELPPAEARLETLLTTLDQHHDEKLFELALAEFQRYSEPERRARVDAFLQSNLRHGAHNPARAIARNLGPFLDDGNIAAYREIADELPADSRRAELLRESLDAYEGGE